MVSRTAEVDVSHLTEETVDPDPWIKSIWPSHGHTLVVFAGPIFGGVCSCGASSGVVPNLRKKADW